MPTLYFEVDGDEPCPIEFAGPSDVLVYFLSLVFATRYGSQHDLSKLALSDLPFTEKSELARDQQKAPPFGSNLSFPLSDYCRYHQTSGSTGVAIRWRLATAGASFDDALASGALLLAAVFPARRAARLNVLEALQYE